MQSVNVVGLATFSNDVTISSNLTVGNSLIVTGTLNATGTGLTHVIGNLGVNSTTTTSALTVTGPTVTSGTLTVSGAANLSDTLTVLGATNISSSCVVGSNLSVAGSTTLTGTTSITGPATVTNNLTVNGAATFNSNLTVLGTTSLGTLNATTVNGAAVNATNMSVTSDFVASNVIATNFSTTNLTTCQVLQPSLLSIVGSATMSSNVILGSASSNLVTVTGSLTTSGAVNIAGTLAVTSNVSIDNLYFPNSNTASVVNAGRVGAEGDVEFLGYTQLPGNPVVAKAPTELTLGAAETRLLTSGNLLSGILIIDATDNSGVLQMPTAANVLGGSASGSVTYGIFGNSSTIAANQFYVKVLIFNKSAFEITISSNTNVVLNGNVGGVYKIPAGCGVEYYLTNKVISTVDWIHMYPVGNATHPSVSSLIANTVTANTIQGNIAATSVTVGGIVQTSLRGDTIQYDTGGAFGTTESPITGTTLTLDLLTCNSPIIELSSDTNTLSLNLNNPGGSLPGGVVGKKLRIVINERGAGRTVSWDSRIKWPVGGVNKLTATVTGVYVIEVDTVTTSIAVATIVVNAAESSGEVGNTVIKIFGYDMSRNVDNSSTRVIADGSGNVYVMGDVRASEGDAFMTVNPPLQTASVAGTGYGSSVVYSTNGLWKAVGVPGANNPLLGLATGAVFIYKHDGNAWTLSETLYPISSSTLEYGKKLVMNDQTLVVGAPSETYNETTNHGNVYVYELVAERWAFIKSLVGTQYASGTKIGSCMSITTSTATIPTIVLGLVYVSSQPDVVFYERVGGVWGSAINWTGDMSSVLRTDQSVTDVDLCDRGLRCSISYSTSDSVVGNGIILTRETNSWSSIDNWAYIGERQPSSGIKLTGMTDANNNSIMIYKETARAIKTAAVAISSSDITAITPNTARHRIMASVYMGANNLLSVWSTPDSQLSSDYNPVWTVTRNKGNSSYQCNGRSQGSLPFLWENRSTGVTLSGYLATCVLGTVPNTFVLDAAYYVTGPSAAAAVGSATAWNWYIVYDGFGYETFNNMDGTYNSEGDLCRASFQGIRGYYVAVWDSNGQFLKAGKIYSPFDTNYTQVTDPVVARFMVVDSSPKVMTVIFRTFLQGSISNRAIVHDLNTRNAITGTGAPYNDSSTNNGYSGWGLVCYAFNPNTFAHSTCSAFYQSQASLGSGSNYTLSHLYGFDVIRHQARYAFIISFWMEDWTGNAQGVSIRSPLLPTGSFTNTTMVGLVGSSNDVLKLRHASQNRPSNTSDTTTYTGSTYLGYVHFVGSFSFTSDMSVDTGITEKIRMICTSLVSNPMSVAFCTGAGTANIAQFAIEVVAYGSSNAAPTLYIAGGVTTSSLGTLHAINGGTLTRQSGQTHNGRCIMFMTAPYFVSNPKSSGGWGPGNTTAYYTQGIFSTDASNQNIFLIAGSRPYWDGNSHNAFVGSGVSMRTTSTLGIEVAGDGSSIGYGTAHAFPSSDWGLTSLVGTSIITYTAGSSTRPAIYSLKTVAPKFELVSYTSSCLLYGGNNEHLIGVDKFSSTRNWYSTFNSTKTQPYCQTSFDNDDFSIISTVAGNALPTTVVRPLVTKIMSTFDKINNATVQKGGYIDNATGSAFIAWGSMMTYTPTGKVTYGSSTKTANTNDPIMFAKTSGNSGTITTGPLVSGTNRQDGYVFDAITDASGNNYVLFTVFGAVPTLLNQNGSVSTKPIMLTTTQAADENPQLILASWSSSGTCRGGCVVYSGPMGHYEPMQDNGRMYVTSSRLAVVFAWRQDCSLDFHNTSNNVGSNVATVAATRVVSQAKQVGIIQVRYDLTAFTYFDNTLLVSCAQPRVDSRHPVAPTPMISLAYTATGDRLYLASAYFQLSTTPGTIKVRDFGSNTDIDITNYALSASTANCYQVVVSAWTAGSHTSTKAMVYSKGNDTHRVMAPLIRLSPDGARFWLACSVESPVVSADTIFYRNSSNVETASAMANTDGAKWFTYTFVCTCTPVETPTIGMTVSSFGRIRDINNIDDGMITPTSLVVSNNHCFVTGCTIGVSMRLQLGNSTNVAGPVSPVSTRDRYLTYIATFANAMASGALTYQNTIATIGTTNQTPLMLLNASGFPDLFYKINGWASNTAIRLLDGSTSATMLATSNAISAASDLSTYRIVNTSLTALDTTNTGLFLTDNASNKIVQSGGGAATTSRLMNTYSCSTVDGRFVIQVFTYDGAIVAITSGIHHTKTSISFTAASSNCFKVGCLIYDNDGIILCGGTILENTVTTSMAHSIYVTGLTALPDNRFAISFGCIVSWNTSGVFTGAGTYRAMDLDGSVPFNMTNETMSVTSSDLQFIVVNLGMCTYNLASNGLSGTKDFSNMIYSYQTYNGDSTGVSANYYLPFQSWQLTELAHATGSYKSYIHGNALTHVNGIIYYGLNYQVSVSRATNSVSGVKSYRYRTRHDTATYAEPSIYAMYRTQLTAQGVSWWNNAHIMLLAIDLKKNSGQNVIPIPVANGHDNGSSSDNYYAAYCAYTMADLTPGSNKVHVVYGSGTTYTTTGALTIKCRNTNLGTTNASNSISNLHNRAFVTVNTYGFPRRDVPDASNWVCLSPPDIANNSWWRILSTEHSTSAVSKQYLRGACPGFVLVSMGSNQNEPHYTMDKTITLSNNTTVNALCIVAMAGGSVSWAGIVSRREPVFTLPISICTSPRFIYMLVHLTPNASHTLCHANNNNNSTNDAVTFTTPTVSATGIPYILVYDLIGRYVSHHMLLDMSSLNNVTMTNYYMSGCSIVFAGGQLHIQYCGLTSTDATTTIPAIGEIPSKSVSVDRFMRIVIPFEAKYHTSINIVNNAGTSGSVVSAPLSTITDVTSVSTDTTGNVILGTSTGVLRTKLSVNSTGTFNVLNFGPTSKSTASGGGAGTVVAVNSNKMSYGQPTFTDGNTTVGRLTDCDMSTEIPVGLTQNTPLMTVIDTTVKTIKSSSIAMSNDGNLMAIGAPDALGAEIGGRVYMFRRDPTTGEWSLLNTIRCSIGGVENTGASRFGTGVALSWDGRVLAVTDPNFHNSLATPDMLGRTLVFLATSQANWASVVNYSCTLSSQANNVLGPQVAVSGDGATIVNFNGSSTFYGYNYVSIFRATSATAWAGDLTNPLTTTGVQSTTAGFYSHTIISGAVLYDNPLPSVSYNGRIIMNKGDLGTNGAGGLTNNAGVGSVYLNGGSSWTTHQMVLPSNIDHGSSAYTFDMVKSLDVAIDGLRCVFASRGGYYFSTRTATTGWATATAITTPFSLEGQGPVRFIGNNVLLFSNYNSNKQLRLIDGRTYTQIASYDGVYTGSYDLCIAVSEGIGSSFIVMNGNPASNVGQNVVSGKALEDVNYTVTSNIGAIVFSQHRPNFSATTPSTSQYIHQIPAGTAKLFGTSMAMSKNGDYMVVGAPDTTLSTHTDRGAAYVYRRQGTTWLNTPFTLAHGDSLCVDYGASVAISADGRFIAVGDPQCNGGVGAVYIWRLSTDNSWTGPTKFTAASTLLFGTSVAFDEGVTDLLVGSPGDTANSLAGAGRVHLYTNVGTTFNAATSSTTQFQAITPIANAGFGTSVSYVEDDTTFLVTSRTNATVISHYFNGSSWSQASVTAVTTISNPKLAVMKNVSGVHVMALPLSNLTGVAVLTKANNANNWVLANTCTAPLSVNFTSNVTITQNSVLVGSSTDVYHYLLSGVLVNKITPTYLVNLTANYMGDFFVTSNKDLVNGNFTGVVDIYTTHPQNGTPTTDVTSSPLVNTTYSSIALRFASSVAMARNGRTVVVGAVDDLNTADGAAYIYIRQGTKWALQQTVNPSDTTCVSFGRTVAIDDAGLTVVVGDPDYNNGVGRIFVWHNTSGVWGNMAVLTCTSSLLLGRSLGISGNGLRIHANTNYNTADSQVLIYHKPGPLWVTVNTTFATGYSFPDTFRLGESVATGFLPVGAAFGVPDHTVSANANAGCIYFAYPVGGGGDLLSVNPPTSGDFFGTYVAMSKEDTTSIIVVGASLTKTCFFLKNSGTNSFGSSVTLASGDAGVLNGACTVSNGLIFASAPAFNGNRGKIYCYNSSGTLLSTYLGTVTNGVFGTILAVDSNATLLAVGDPVAVDDSSNVNVGKLRIFSTKRAHTSLVTRTGGNPPTTPSSTLAVGSGESWSTGWASDGSIIWQLKTGLITTDATKNNAGTLVVGHYLPTSNRNYTNAAGSSTYSGLPSTILPSLGHYVLHNAAGTTFTFGAMLPTTAHTNSWTKFTCAHSESSVFYVGGVINNTTATINKLGESNNVFISPTTVSAAYTGINQVAVIGRMDSTGSPVGQWASYIRANTVGISITPKYITSTGMVVVEVDNPGGGKVSITAYSNPSNPVTGPTAYVSLTKSVVLLHINLSNGTWLSAVTVDGTPTTSGSAIMKIYAIGAAKSVASVYFEHGGSRTDILDPLSPGGILNVYPNGSSTPVTNTCANANMVVIYTTSSGTVSYMKLFGGTFNIYPNRNAVVARTSDYGITLHTGGSAVYERSTSGGAWVRTINRMNAATTVNEALTIILDATATYYRHFIVADDDDNAGVEVVCSVSTGNGFVVWVEFRNGENSTSASIATYNGTTLPAISSFTLPANSSNSIVLTGSPDLTWNV